MGDRWALLPSCGEKRKKLKQFLSRFLIPSHDGRGSGSECHACHESSHDVISSISHPRCVVLEFSQCQYSTNSRKARSRLESRPRHCSRKVRPEYSRRRSHSHRASACQERLRKPQRSSQPFSVRLPSRLHGVVLNYFPQANPEDPQSALNAIPKAVLQRARGVQLFIPTSSSPLRLTRRTPFFLTNIGLAVFQVLKAGFVFSGKAGSGLVIARLPDGSWSAPSCIATGGVGWGLQIGADITDFVVVLNSEDAVRAFSLGGNVTIAGNISAAAGPIGTGGSVLASLAHPAPMFSYSKSKGASLTSHNLPPLTA